MKSSSDMANKNEATDERNENEIEIDSLLENNSCLLLLLTDQSKLKEIGMIFRID